MHFTKKVQALSGLLLLSIQYPSVTVSAFSRDSVCAKLEATSGWKAAYNYHRQCKNYHQPYFKPTFDSVKPMHLSIWYNDTISGIYDANPAYRTSNITEAELFAKTMAGDGDFQCNVLDSPCNRKFTPRQITDHLADMHPEWEPQRLMEEAQKTTVALEFIETSNRLHVALHSLFGVVQTNQGQQAGSIVRYFTNQKNRDSSQLCRIKEKVLAWCLSLMENMMYFGWSFIQSDDDTASQALKGASQLVQSGMQLTQNTIESVVDHFQLDAEDMWREARKNNTDGLRLEIAYSVGLCGDIGGNFEPMNWENQATMSEYVQQLFTNLREMVERLNQEIMMGSWTDSESKSLIAHLLSKPDMLEWYERLKRDLTAFEKDMTTHFGQALQSASLVSDQCYLKCVRDAKQKRKTENCNPEGWWNKESRFCPADDEHTICQLECLTLQDKRNHLQKPPGMEKSKQWYGIGQTAIAEASWRNRRRKGSNKLESDSELVAHGILELDARLNSGVPPYQLPVSISEYGHLVEFDDGVDPPGHNLTLNQQFPCISGDWTASGTRDFMKRLDLGPDGRDVVSGMARELIEEICPRNLQATPPVTHYFATCELGIQYPRHEFMLKPGEDYYYKIKHGPSEHCGALLKEARENHMTEGQGNYHFCKESPLFKRVLNEENHSGGLVLSPVEEWPWHGQSTRWRCQHWLKLYEKEFKYAGVKNSDDVRKLEDQGRRFPMKKK